MLSVSAYGKRLQKPMATSIYEVAAEANVSIATVSRVLNGKTCAQVAVATQERVREAARRLEYHPSGVARGLARGRMNTIGLVLYYEQSSVTSDPYLGPCLDGILAVHKRNHQNTILFTKSSWSEALEHLPSYCNGHCDGLMLILPRTDSALVDALAVRKIPFVLVGDSRNDPGLLCADVDNVHAGRAAVQHLIGLGHRRIAAFRGNSVFSSSEQRLIGYRQALEEAGIVYDTALVQNGSYFPSPELCEENVRTLLARPLSERPTAIFCFNDNMALGTLRTLQRYGISVPHDISVIGFDDVPNASTVSPALTTMRQPIHEIGEHAANLLLAQINGTTESEQNKLLPAEIIVRASTGVPPPAV